MPLEQCWFRLILALLRWCIKLVFLPENPSCVRSSIVPFHNWNRQMVTPDRLTPVVRSNLIVEFESTNEYAIWEDLPFKVKLLNFFKCLHQIPMVLFRFCFHWLHSWYPWANDPNLWEWLLLSISNQARESLVIFRRSWNGKKKWSHLSKRSSFLAILKWRHEGFSIQQWVLFF